MKPFYKLTPRDFRKHAVWEFCNDLESRSSDETVMRPFVDLPVSDLANRVVGTTLRFANGDTTLGVLGNVDLNNHVMTEHFLTLTLYRKDGAAFHLARYFDVMADTRGPKACAEFFGLDVTDVFPIAYDIGSVAIGVPSSVRRKIPAQPFQRLDDDERMRMVLQ